jgi:hypothetical protein
MTPSNQQLQFGQSNYGTSTGTVTNQPHVVQVPEGGSSLAFALCGAVTLGVTMAVIAARRAVKSLN